MSESQVNADAALARALVEQEARQARLDEAELRRREWESYHYSRQYPYYYGTWRSPGYRPVVVYRERDPCTDVWLMTCVFFWLAALIVVIIIAIIYG